jgi:hypothetical protein
MPLRLAAAAGDISRFCHMFTYVGLRLVAARPALPARALSTWGISQPIGL